MLRHGAIGVFVLLFSLGLIASCSSLNSGMEPSPASPAAAQNAAPEGQGFEGLAFPVDGPSKDASWVSTMYPNAPFLEHRTYPCPVHPNGLVLEGLHDMPVTYMPPQPWFAYAIYQVPLGVHEDDLLTLTLAGEMPAGENYFVALANFDALHWEWFGPAGPTADLVLDFSTIGYDITGAWGNMYFAVVVPQAMTLHLEEIELDFAGYPPGAGPTYWNVWGQTYDDMALGLTLPGLNVTFEDQLTGTVYSTMTGGDGGWGTNLPDGYYEFDVPGCASFFDPSTMMVIEALPVLVEVNAGDIIYHGPNAAYDGTVIPMPLITLNVY